MKIVRQTVFIIVVAMLMALLQGLFLDRSAWTEKDAGSVTLSEAREFGEVLWVDARAPGTYAMGHLPGALHLTEEEWDEELEVLLFDWEPDQPIIVYCDGGGCESSRAISERLRRELGVDSVYWLKGGWDVLAGEGNDQ